MRSKEFNWLVFPLSDGECVPCASAFLFPVPWQYPCGWVWHGRGLSAGTPRHAPGVFSLESTDVLGLEGLKAQQCVLHLSLILLLFCPLTPRHVDFLITGRYKNVLVVLWTDLLRRMREIDHTNVMIITDIST